eukprot:1466877-Rhodomonas_salina.3
MVLSAYVRPMRCPVLRKGLAVPDDGRRGKPPRSRGISQPHGIPLPSAMPGTDIAAPALVLTLRWLVLT